jgi:hypothetical protein
MAGLLPPPPQAASAVVAISSSAARIRAKLAVRQKVVCILFIAAPPVILKRILCDVQRRCKCRRATTKKCAELRKFLFGTGNFLARFEHSADRYEMIAAGAFRGASGPMAIEFWGATNRLRR